MSTHSPIPKSFTEQCLRMFCIWIFLLPVASSAQNWEWVKQISHSPGYTPFKVLTLPDGDFATVGTIRKVPLQYQDSVYEPVVTPAGSERSGIVVSRYNPDGSLEWLKIFGTRDTASLRPMNQPYMAADSQGNLLIGYYHPEIYVPLVFSAADSSSGGSFGVVKLSAAGAFLHHWQGVTTAPANGDSIVGIGTDASGNVYVNWRGGGGLTTSGIYLPPTNPDFDYDGYLLKLSPQLQPLWAKQFPKVYMRNLVVEETGNCVFTCLTNQVPPEWNQPSVVDYTGFHVRYSPSGQFMSAGRGVEANLFQQSLIASSDGEFYASGHFYTSVEVQGVVYQGIPATHAWVARLNADFSVEWFAPVFSASPDPFPALSIYIKHQGLTTDESGAVFFSSAFYQPFQVENQTYVANDPSQKFFLIKFSPTGTVRWVSKSGGSYLAYQPGAKLLVAGSFANAVSTGNLGQLQSVGPVDAFVGQIRDLNVPIIYNRLKGTVFHDLYADCLQSVDEEGIPYWALSLTPGPGYAFTDADGNYDILVDSGSYQVKVSPPATMAAYTFPICLPEGRTCTFDSLGSTISGFDFPLKLDIPCVVKVLSVNVTTNFRRRCFRSETRITYANDGWEPAEDNQVIVQIPDNITFISASNPYTLLPDGRYSFEVGDLGAFETGQIVIHDSVNCTNENELNASVCIRVEILNPDTCRVISPNWDGADLLAGAACIDSSLLRLWVTNIGAQDMTDSVEYRIFGSSGLLTTGKLILQAGDSLVIQTPGYGQSLRIEVDQTPDHPVGSWVAATVENCGEASLKTAPGLLVQYPTYDATRIFDFAELCLPVTGSFDPNDKRGFPLGWSESGNIEPGTKLNYIIRFQNTGNDTAFKIVLRDTLPLTLNPASLRFQGASHPCQWSLESPGQAVLRVVFDPIALPDSNRNLAGSQGYFAFSIDPADSLPLGTEIHNFADIYFDFNEPVRTDTTWHTLALPPVPGPGAPVLAPCVAGAVFADAGVDQVLCDPDSIVLQASMSPGALGRWSLLSGENEIGNEWAENTFLKQVLPGTYQLLWKVYGCQSSATDTVQISVQKTATPTLSVTAPATVTATGVSAAEAYEWLLNGSALPGSGASVQATEAGAYQVRALENGCWSAYSAALDFFPQRPGEVDARLFPNPGNGEVYVVLQLPVGDSVNLMVTDLRNQLLYQQVAVLDNVGRATVRIELPHPAAGIYLLDIRAQGVRLRRKILIL